MIGMQNMEIYFFQDISPVQFFETKVALYKYHAIYFPGQQLSEEDHPCFASQYASGLYAEAETLVTSDQTTIAKNEYDSGYGRHVFNVFERPST